MPHTELCEHLGRKEKCSGGTGVTKSPKRNMVHLFKSINLIGYLKEKLYNLVNFLIVFKQMLIYVEYDSKFKWIFKEIFGLEVIQSILQTSWAVLCLGGTLVENTRKHCVNGSPYKDEPGSFFLFYFVFLGCLGLLTSELTITLVPDSNLWSPSGSRTKEDLRLPKLFRSLQRYFIGWLLQWLWY